ncbi:MAG: hypothetical protein R3B81_09895 [bacterium]
MPSPARPCGPARALLRRVVACCCAFSILSVTVSPAGAASGREELSAAEDYFLVADFSTALTKVSALIESGDLSGGALRDAWILRARCELASAWRSRAVDSFCAALAIDAGWLPDRDLFTADELNVFDQARSSCPDATTTGTTPPSYLPPSSSSGGSWYSNKLVWGAVGAAAVAGAVLSLGGGEDGGANRNPLPPLPDPPTN